MTDSSKIEVKPSFVGYAISLNKFSSGTLNICEKCVYYITFVDSEEKKSTKVQFKIKAINNDIELNSNTGDIDLVGITQAICYHYHVEKSFHDQNMIISSTLFSGRVHIWATPGENEYRKTKNAGSIKKKYEVDQEKIIKISPDERMYNGTISDDMYICVWGIRSSSYFIRVNMETETENHQNTNELFNGKVL